MALEPITRQEQIIAGKDLQPITRMEKFLKEYGGGSGGAPSKATRLYLNEEAYVFETEEQIEPMKFDVFKDRFLGGERFLFVMEYEEDSKQYMEIYTITGAYYAPGNNVAVVYAAFGSETFTFKLAP